MKRRILLAFACLIAATGIMAQTDSKTLRKAYDFRTDIHRSVLKQTHKWPGKCGILHSDWIENTNGKSIDLNGNVLFPNYNYTQLEQRCNGNLWVMTVNGKKGVVDKNGKLLLDFKYSYIDFSPIASGEVIVLEQGGAVMRGQGKRIKITESITFYAMWDRDTAAFSNNAWVDRFAFYYSKHQYHKAKFCMDYYTQYEQSSLYSNRTLPLYQTARYNLLALEHRNDYESVIAFVRGGYMPGTHFDAGKDILEIQLGNDYTISQRTAIAKEVEYINTNYQICKKKMAMAAEAKEARAQRATVAAAIILGAAAMTAAAYSGTPTTPYIAPAATGGGAVPATNGSYIPADNTPYSNDQTQTQSSSSSQSENIQTCSHCNGTGKILYESSGGIPDKDKHHKIRCSECGREYWSIDSHTHKTCHYCQGCGKIKYTSGGAHVPGC